MSVARHHQISTLWVFTSGLAVGGWVGQAQGWGWGAMAGLLTVFGYALLLAVEFVFVAMLERGDPSPRPTLWQFVRAWWGEVCMTPRIFFWQQPFRSLHHPDFLPDAAGSRGVVLVHGFVCNRGFWNSWMPRLRRLGIPHVAVSLEPVFGDIDAYAQQLDEAVRRIEAATGLPPVLVAHSMGGLVVRAWLAGLAGPSADARVQRVLTIGSPHRGTHLARLAARPNLLQMRRDPCPWRHALEAREPTGRFAKFTCFYSHCDNVVFPASTATLPGADNRHLPGVAHVQLLDQPVVFNEALAWLGAVDAGHSPALARQDR